MRIAVEFWRSVERSYNTPFAFVVWQQSSAPSGGWDISRWSETSMWIISH